MRECFSSLEYWLFECFSTSSYQHTNNYGLMPRSNIMPTVKLPYESQKFIFAGDIANHYQMYLEEAEQIVAAYFKEFEDYEDGHWGFTSNDFFWVDRDLFEKWFDQFRPEENPQE